MSQRSNFVCGTRAGGPFCVQFGDGMSISKRKAIQIPLAEVAAYYEWHADGGNPQYIGCSV